MTIEQADDFLLMIEPTTAPEALIVDDATRAAAYLLNNAEHGTYDPDFQEWAFGQCYRGHHGCTGKGCLAHGDNKDHNVAGGICTHSMLVHYLACHRSCITQADLDRVIELANGGRAEPSIAQIFCL